MKNPLTAWQQTTSKATRVLCYALLGTLSFLVLLPLALKVAILYGLSRGGFSNTELDDVDLNLFSGELQIKQLAIKQPSHSDLELGQLSVNFGWLALLKGQFQLEDLTIKNLELQLIEDPDGRWHVVIPINTEPSSPSASQADQETLSLPLLEAKHIAFNQVTIKINGQQLQGRLNINTLNVDAISNWRTEPSHLHLKGHWNNTPVTLNIAAELVKPEPDLNAQLTVSDFQLHDIAALTTQLSQQQVSALQGQLSLAIELNAKQLSASHWQAEINNSIKVQQVNVAIDDLSLTNEQLSWVGNTQLQYHNDQLSYQLTGDLTNQQLAITDPQQALELVTLKSLSLQQLSVKNDQSVAFEDLTLQQLNLLKALTEKRGALNTGAISFHQGSLSANKQLHIGQITIHDGQYILALNSTAQPVIGEQLNHYVKEPAASPNDRKDTSLDTADAVQWLIRLDQLLVSGDSFIQFIDHSISPTVNQTLHIETLSLDSLDQSQTENHSPLTVKAKLGEFSDINVSGWLSPFSTSTTAKLNGSIKALALPPFSGYAEKAIGYQIPNGQLDHLFELNLNKETIAMSNKIKLRRFDLIATDEKKNQLLSSTMGVSLGFGLDVLRDNDDSIQLDVPIKGRLDDPKVGLSTIVSKAMGSAITKGSISYLKYAIQPYGTLLSVGNMLGKQLAKIDFEAVKFSPANAELPPDTHAYLDKIAGLLVKRSGIEIAVCGHVNHDDQQALTAQAAASNPNPEQASSVTSSLEAQLLTLATQRANAVKRYLLTKQVKSEQLLLCKPSSVLGQQASVSLSM